MAEAESVQENAAKKAVRDVLDGRRSFVFDTPTGESKEYFIADPAGEDIRKADWNYSKVFNQAMTDGFPTQAQMLEVLEERGIINTDYHTEVEKTRIGLAASLFRLENLDEDSDDLEREGTALEVAELRDELFRLNQKVNGPLGNTCENLAEDARTEFLTSRIIQKSDGSHLWENFDSYRNETNTALCVKCRLEVMLWLQGLESNFLENTPEQAALRKIAQKRLDEALGKFQEATKTEDEELFVEKEIVVEELKLPEIAEEKPVRKKATTKKKVGRPKGSKKEETPKDE
jgi:hypothetical protein